MATYFETADFVLAATIMATTGAQPLHVEGPPGDFLFQFEDTTETRLIARAFDTGSVRVEPMLFVLAERSLRRMLMKGMTDEDSPTGLLF